MAPKWLSACFRPATTPVGHGAAEQLTFEQQQLDASPRNANAQSQTEPKQLRSPPVARPSSLHAAYKPSGRGVLTPTSSQARDVQRSGSDRGPALRRSSASAAAAVFGPRSSVYGTSAIAPPCADEADGNASDSSCTSSSSSSTYSSSDRLSLEALFSNSDEAAQPATLEASPKATGNAAHPASCPTVLQCLPTHAAADQLSDVLTSLPPVNAPNPQHYRRSRTTVGLTRASAHPHARHAAMTRRSTVGNNPQPRGPINMPLLELSDGSSDDDAVPDMPHTLFSRFTARQENIAASHNNNPPSSGAAPAATFWSWAQQLTSPTAAPTTMTPAAAAVRTTQPNSASPPNATLTAACCATLSPHAALQQQAAATARLARSFEQLLQHDTFDSDSSDEEDETDGSSVVCSARDFGTPLLFVEHNAVAPAARVSTHDAGRARRRGMLAAARDLDAEDEVVVGAADLNITLEPTLASFADAYGLAFAHHDAFSGAAASQSVACLSSSCCSGPLALQELGSSWGSTLSHCQLPRSTIHP